MDLLEHQGKTLFAAGGLPVPRACVAASVAEALTAAGDLGLPVAVKAQVKTGGRGKAGGIRLCATASDVGAAAEAILALTIRGKSVEALLVEKAVDIEREMYLALVSSRSARGPLLVFSRQGGVDIEALAEREPGALVRTPIDPLLGLCDYQARDVVAAASLPDSAGRQMATLLHAAWRLYHDRDATLLEVNPLVLTRRGTLVCLDSKVTIDDNALGRQPDLRPGEPEDAQEERARQAGLAFVALDGDIGVLGNGAGLVMSTIDQIAAAGGAAADFCDIGGGARADTVRAALDVILAMPRVKAVLVSVFGGITRCDEVAGGLVEVLAEAPPTVPIVVRLDGNAAEEGRAVLAAARLVGVTVAPDARAAVRAAVAATQGSAAVAVAAASDAEA